MDYQGQIEDAMANPKPSQDKHPDLQLLFGGSLLLTLAGRTLLPRAVNKHDGFETFSC